MTHGKTVRLVAGVMGLLMATIALASGLRGSFGRIEFLLLILGLAGVAAAILGPRAGSAYRSAAVVGLNTVLLFLALELSAGVLLNLVWRLRSGGAIAAPPAKPSDPEESPFYSDQDWAPRFWAELHDVWRGAWYQPHELWRRRPYAGQLINISSDGLRLTPGAECKSGALVVYTFGGSTMWGFGAPDWGTIPAYLQAHWSRTMSRPVCVVNFGQLGYTSTQGLIALQRRLQRCEIPDAVVFYDGVNDLRYGHLAGMPGAHSELRETAQKLEGDLPVEPSGVQTLNLLQLVRAFRPEERPPPHRYQEQPDSVAAGLGAGIAEAYLNNLRMVSALGREYGFTHDFFWQPWIWMGKKPLTDAEKRIRGSYDEVAGPTGPDGERAVHRLYRQVYASIARAARSEEHLHDVSDVFDSVPSLIYLDSHHLTPDGNRLVAERMLLAMGDQIGNPAGARSARACRTTASDR